MKYGRVPLCKTIIGGKACQAVCNIKTAGYYHNVVVWLQSNVNIFFRRDFGDLLRTIGYQANAITPDSLSKSPRKMAA